MFPVRFGGAFRGSTPFASVRTVSPKRRVRSVALAATARPRGIMMRSRLGMLRSWPRIGRVSSAMNSMGGVLHQLVDRLFIRASPRFQGVSDYLFTPEGCGALV